MLKVIALSIGVINITTGKTMYDWGIYDYENEGEVYLTNDRFLLFGAPGSLKNEDNFDIRHNDTNRLLQRNIKIVDISPNNKEDVLKMLKRNGYDYYPLRPFQARAKNNRTLKTSYSIKGITE